MSWLSFIIGLCVLREFVWVPGHGLATKRLALGVLVALLTACAGHGSPASCPVEAGAQQITYPDGYARKSDIAVCPDHYHVSFVNDASQSFDVYNQLPVGYLPPSDGQ